MNRQIYFELCKILSRINGVETGKKQKTEEVPDQNDNEVNWGDLCAVCGKYVPEGRDICPNCEKMSKGARR